MKHIGNIIIFDLDGTLANNDHRRYMVEGQEKDFKSFEYGYNIILDEPKIPIISLIQALYKTREFEIIICSGRREHTKSATLEWLDNHNIPFDRIYFRDDSDNRSDHLVKKDFLDIIGKENVLFTVDDRQKVVDMWRENGITCLQCDYGNF